MERVMSIPKNNRYEDYFRYAKHCLDLVTQLKSQDDRIINREMAAEWLRLADAIALRLKPERVGRAGRALLVKPDLSESADGPE